MKTNVKLMAAAMPLALLAFSNPATAQVSPTVTAIAVPTAAGIGCSLPSGIFAIGVAVNGGACQAISANTAENLFDKLTETAGLESINPNYTNLSAATLAIRFNSLPITLETVANTPTVRFVIAPLGIDIQETKATRDDSLEAIVDQIKDTDLIAKIMKYQAANSPASPITGAGGLIPNVVTNDFNQNFTDSATNIAAPAKVAVGATTNGSANNLIGLAMQYSSLTIGDSKTKVTSLPLSYTYRNDIDPRRQLTISMPLTQIDTDGAKSYMGGLGVAYRFPINDNWTLTPSGKISGVGSLDMATVAGLYSYSLTSTYIWAMNGFDVAMGNMLSQSKTMKFKSGDYAFDPDIKSTAFRNGVMLSQPVELGGKRMSVEYSLIDTRYSGTTTFMKDAQEIGITIGTNKNAFTSRSFLRAGLSYMTSKDAHGVTFNFGYWF